MWLVLLLVVFVTSNAVSFFVLLQIRDEIEAGLPIKDRQSWRLWGVRSHFLKQLRLHRDKFPSSRLRILWILATLVSLGCLIGLVVGAVLGSHVP